MPKIVTVSLNFLDELVGNLLKSKENWKADLEAASR